MTTRIHLAPSLGALVLALGACGGGETAPAVEAPIEPEGYLGPEIWLDAPARGAMLLEGGAGPVPVWVSGQACDAVHRIAAIRIGTEVLAPSGDARCQSFRVQHSSRRGLNVVRGEVENDVGQRARLSHAFIRSPEYFPTESGNPDGRAESGLLVELRPAFVDDGDRASPNDVATLTELELAKLDLEGSVGSPRFADPDSDGDGHIDRVTHGCLLYSVRNKRTGFEAWKDGPLGHAGITVDRLALEDGGVSARITVWAPRVPFSVTGNQDLGCLGDAQKTVRGDVRAGAITLDGRAAVGLDLAGRPFVSFSAVEVELSGLDIDIDLGVLVDWTGLGSLIGDAIEGQVRGPIADAIAGAVQGLLEDRVSTAFASLADIRTSVVLPAALNATELVFESGVDHLDFVPGRAAFGFALQVRPATPRPEHALAGFGAMRMGGALPGDSGFTGSSLVLGVSDDALNQLLHAAWLGGAFDGDGLLPLDGFLTGSRISLFAHLPPLLMPRSPDAPGIDLGVGDVAFDLRLEGTDEGPRVKGFVSAMVSLERLEVGPDGRSLSPVFGPAEVDLEVTEVNWDDLPRTRMMANELLRGALEQVLSGQLAEALRALPLPDVDLRGIDSSLPPVVLSLGEAQVGRLESHHLLGVTVSARP